ncbi:MAG: hypothetical protein GYB31_12070 [Bacteroidetes bacterium]|nr:hypothetical protein [Bacteroidota bacterium]
MLLLSGFGLKAQQHNFLTYSLEEGLPQSQVFALLSDSKGYMWFGTQGGGLSRFDGADFTYFSAREGLSANYVYTLLEDSFHRVWAGTSRGLNLITGKEIKTIPFPEDVGRVSGVLQQNDSLFWVGTNKGIWEITHSIHSEKTTAPEKLNLHSGIDDAFITCFLKHQQSLWVGTDQGLFRITEDRGVIPPAPGNTRAVQQMAIDSSGHIWVAIFGRGLEKWPANGNQAQNRWNDQRISQATSVFVSSDQRIWLGTQNNGAWIYHPADSSWTHLTEQKGLPNNNVRQITEDHWGNIWIATSGGGACKYLGQFFLHYDRSNGLPDERVYALDIDSSGSVWASVGNSGLARLDSIGFKPFEGDSAYLNMKSKALHFDRKGRLWTGTEGGGLLVFDTSGFEILDTEDGLPSNWIRDIEEDASGSLWIATYGSGLANVTDLDTLGFGIRKYGRESGFNDLRIMDLALDPRGRLWFCTRYGEVGYVDGGRVKQLFDAASGLPAGQIRSIAFDDLNQIWLGTAGAGLFVKNLDPDSLRFLPFQANAELTSSNLYLTVFDKEGNLWVGNERGVDKILLNEAGVVTEVQSYGRNEGFLGIETCLNAALCDPDGNLWFGTLNGLTRHLPAERVDRKVPPLIHFQEVSLFYKPLDETAFAEWAARDGGIQPGLDLPWKQNHLRFSIRAIDLNDPTSLKYRWMLEGSETEWSPFNEQQSVNYTNLPPGNYTFKAQAVSGTGLLSEVISSSFTIKEPFWQLRWVQILAASVLAAILFLLIRWRFIRFKRKEKQKRAQLEMENKMLHLEQKALQLQMNPHFIFNALNSIQSLVATQDYTTARREINHFASLMRAILSNSRKQKISLAEEKETLDRYLKMEQFCQTTPFEYAIHLPENLDPEEVEIPPMLLQPFVENAVIHGISHLNHPGKLDIRFAAKGDLLHCTITDNGVGRERADALRKSKAPGHQSVAMQVTRERLEALLADKGVKALEVSDVLDEKGKIAGTKVLVRLPLMLNY